MGKKDNFTEQGKQITSAGDMADAGGNAAETVEGLERLHREKALAQEAAGQQEEQKRKESPAYGAAAAAVEAVFRGQGAGEAAAGKPYLVMGAVLRCSCGSHARRLNLPLDHGVYMRGLPMIHEEDCLAGEGCNITAFGVCSSEGHPANVPFWEKICGKYIEDAELRDTAGHKILLQVEDGRNVRGYPCIPCIAGCWRDVNRTYKIVRNNTAGLREEDKLSAVTTGSFLVCAYGGLIEPVSSGQDEPRGLAGPGEPTTGTEAVTERQGGRRNGR